MGEIQHGRNRLVTIGNQQLSINSDMGHMASFILMYMIVVNCVQHVHTKFYIILISLSTLSLTRTHFGELVKS